MPVAVVTGASSAIGSAIVKKLSDRGYDLIVPTHSDFDLSDAQGQDAFCEHVRSKTTTVDVLVHNAACFEVDNIRNVSRGSWNYAMGLNAEAPLFITQALLPLLEAAQSPSIVNLIDCMYDCPWKNYLSYGASKALLAHITASLALQLAPKVRVNAIAPGTQIVDKIPMKRLATVDEIASAVVYLACNATYTTGEILSVDGGRHLV